MKRVLLYIASAVVVAVLVLLAIEAGAQNPALCLQPCPADKCTTEFGCLSPCQATCPFLHASTPKYDRWTNELSWEITAAVICTGCYDDDTNKYIVKPDNTKPMPCVFKSREVQRDTLSYSALVRIPALVSRGTAPTFEPGPLFKVNQFSPQWQSVGLDIGKTCPTGIAGWWQFSLDATPALMDILWHVISLNHTHEIYVGKWHTAASGNTCVDLISGCGYPALSARYGAGPCNGLGIYWPGYVVEVDGGVAVEERSWGRTKELYR